MPVTTLSTAEKIMNRVAAECGIAPVNDPFGAADPVFTQLRYLLNVAGEELCQAYPWGLLQKSEQFITLDTDDGDYELPEDFNYMTDQTGWERSQNVPLAGGLSAQDWTYLLGRDLVSHTIYASFRITQGKFKLFPQPPPVGLDINYEYSSKNWVQDGVSTDVYKDEVEQGTDIPQFDKTLISRYLKVKFLEAKGFDSAKAQDDFYQTFSFLTGKDKTSQILNVGGSGRGFPYLDGYRNVPDSGYGK